MECPPQSPKAQSWSCPPVGQSRDARLRHNICYSPSQQPSCLAGKRRYCIMTTKMKEARSCPRTVLHRPEIISRMQTNSDWWQLERELHKPYIRFVTLDGIVDVQLQDSFLSLGTHLSIFLPIIQLSFPVCKNKKRKIWKTFQLRRESRDKKGSLMW